MDSEALHDLLRRANESVHDEMLFIRPLLNNIDVAMVWFSSSSPQNNMPKLSGPCRFYFVKEERGKYIAVVMDGVSNLHWYTLSSYRGNGYLSNALRLVILPHIFQDRSLQKITIDFKAGKDVHPEASVMLARSVGFKFIKRENEVEEYELTGEIFDSIEYFDGELVELRSLRAETLKSRIEYHSKNLQIICSELIKSFGKTDELDEIDQDIKSLYLNMSSIIVNAYEDKKIVHNDNKST